MPAISHLYLHPRRKGVGVVAGTGCPSGEGRIATLSSSPTPQGRGGLPPDVDAPLLLLLSRSFVTVYER